MGQKNKSIFCELYSQMCVISATWPALRATLILSSLLKTRLDLLGGRVGFTTSLSQLYFDYRLDFCKLSIITIPFYMNISHDNLYAVNKNTVWLVASLPRSRF